MELFHIKMLSAVNITLYVLGCWAGHVARMGEGRGVDKET